MTTIEDRVREAARAAAGTVAAGSAPPLRLPDRRGLLGWWRADARRSGWVAMVAAAAAVAAAIGTSVAVSGAIHAHRPHPRQASSAVSPLAGLPAYYVTLSGHGKLGRPPYRAVVRATTTGAVVARVSPPRPYRTFELVATGGNGLEFVLSATRLTVVRSGGGVFFNNGPPRFYLLRIGRGGGPARLTALPMAASAANEADSAALSPDGSKLALALRGGGGGPGPAIKVFTLATGAERVWTWPGGPPITNNSGGNGEVLSWAANGTLAFQQWAGNSIDVRFLDTAAPGGSLRRDSRLALQWRNDAESVHFSRGKSTNVIFGFSAIITPDGSKIVAATSSVSKRPLSSELAFTEFAPFTGRVERVLYPWHLPGLYPGQVQDVLWSNPAGSKLIVVAHPPGPPVRLSARHPVAGYQIELGVVSGHIFVPLPRASLRGPGQWPVW
jgi:hypothetical protein